MLAVHKNLESIIIFTQAKLLIAILGIRFSKFIKLYV